MNKEYDFNDYIVDATRAASVTRNVNWDGGFDVNTITIETLAENLKKRLRNRPVDSLSLEFINNIVNVTRVEEKLDPEDKDEVIVALILDVCESISASRKTLSGKDIYRGVKYMLDALVSIPEYKNLQSIRVNAVVWAATFGVKDF